MSESSPQRNDATDDEPSPLPYGRQSRSAKLERATIGCAGVVCFIIGVSAILLGVWNLIRGLGRANADVPSMLFLSGIAIVIGVANLALSYRWYRQR